MIDVFQRTSRNCRKLFGRKLFGLITCGRGVARVSATLVIDVRERFISAACRLCRFWKRLGVQCRLGGGRAVQVVLRVVVDWKREGEAETSKEMTWLTRLRILRSTQR